MINSIHRITVAVTHMEKMVAFYNAVFAAELTPFEPFEGVTMYRGQLAGINLLFCPNQVAQVQAQQNRQQFNFWVDDVFKVMQVALKAGGTQLDAPKIVESIITGSVYDPDGNSIEFVQQQKETSS